MEGIFEKVANFYGVSAEEVEKEIEQALLISKKSQSRKAQEFWQKLEKTTGNPSTKACLNAILVEHLQHNKNQGRN